MTERSDHEATLAAAGRAADAAIDVAEAALALAALDRPRVGLERYRAHLEEMVADARGHRGDGPPAAVLAATVAGRFGYAGDRETYDDLQNANLIRVIDRRRGLPVALGILYMHVGRSLGWRVDGLAFPAHFLIRVEGDGARAILDPFERGRTLETPALRQLLKAMLGAEAELEAGHHAPVGTRDVLLRLQNNIKSRALQQQDAERAHRALAAMLLLAPALAGLHLEMAVLEAHRGNLGAALERAGAAERLAADDGVRARAALLRQQLGRRLN